MKTIMITTNNEISIKDYTESLSNNVFENTWPAYSGQAWPEFIYTDNGKDLVLAVDEIGRLKNLPINKIASFLYGDTIVGDVLVLHKVMTGSGPDYLPFETEEAEEVYELLKTAFSDL